MTANYGFGSVGINPVEWNGRQIAQSGIFYDPCDRIKVWLLSANDPSFGYKLCTIFLEATEEQKRAIKITIDTFVRGRGQQKRCAMKTKRKEKVRMKVPSAKECECGYGLATEIEADGGRICLRCAMLLGCAAEMGVTASEFAAVPVKKRLAFLNERLNLAVISGKYEINADWARKVWTMLDQIKVDRARAGLPSVSRYQTS